MHNSQYDSDERVFRFQLVELRKKYQEERENRLQLEKKCVQLESHIDRINLNYQGTQNNNKTLDYKQQMLNEGQKEKISVIELQENISYLEEQLQESQQKENYMKQDNEKNKNKLEIAIAQKNKKEEEFRELNARIEELKYQLSQRQRECEKKDEEIINFQLQIDSYKFKINHLQQALEKHEERCEKYKEMMDKDNELKDINLKKINELNEKNQRTFSENERIKQDNYNLQSSIYEKENELENLKNELYEQKQIFFEKNQKELTTYVQMEKQSMEISQLRGLLHRAENELQNSKKHNEHLMKQLTSQTPQQLKNTFNRSFDQIDESEHLGNRERESREHFQEQEQIQEKSKALKLYQQRQKLLNGEQEQNGHRDETEIPVKRIQQTENIDKSQLQASGGWRGISCKPKDHNIFGQTNEQNQNTQIQNHKNKQQQREKEQQNNFKEDAPRKSFNPIRDNQEEARSSYQDPRDGSRRQQATRDQDPKRTFPTRERNPIIAPQEDNNDNSRFQKPVVIQDKGQRINEIENKLMLLNLEKTNMENEYRKLDENKLKSGYSIRRKNEIQDDLEHVKNNISQLRMKLRELNQNNPF